MTICTIDVHARDVVAKLVAQKVNIKHCLGLHANEEWCLIFRVYFILQNKCSFEHFLGSNYLGNKLNFYLNKL